MDILSQMHVYFIRPQLEYAAELWAGCTIKDGHRKTGKGSITCCKNSKRPYKYNHCFKKINLF